MCRKEKKFPLSKFSPLNKNKACSHLGDGGLGGEGGSGLGGLDGDGGGGVGGEGGGEPGG